MFDSFRARVAVRVDRELDRLLPAANRSPAPLYRAMRYAVLAPGKRFRPAIVRLGFETFGGRSRGAWDAAAAIEMAHAFSLAHDDLPCMDDDDIRRGRPTLHKKFGEAVALLAGDALLAAAFQVASEAGGRHDGPAREKSLRELAEAVGPAGMVGGQVLDMLGEGRPATRTSVRRIHRLKTGALIRACARIGAHWAGAGTSQVEQVGRIADTLGLAFQVGDDYLNATASRRQLGKAGGSDAARRKATYVRAVGLDATRKELARLCDEARSLARGLPGRQRMWSGLADFVEARRN